MNDGISMADSSLSYMSGDDVAKMVAKMGVGTLLGKMDVQSAYQIIPVHPEDHWLLGMQWQGRVCVWTPASPLVCSQHPSFFTAVARGVGCESPRSENLLSAPIIFTAVANALEWVVKAQGVRDFITAGAPATEECQANMTCLSHTYEQFGVPLAPHKSEGSATCSKFLGIDIDTMSMELRLLADKLLKVKETV